MSTIERLSIQGIRSFGGNAGDNQMISFTSPVTLILGENGCGKTTVIECLKYALTGECPPGSDRGKNFVHDPKIFNLTDVLGQIKLEVRNVQGARLSICRSMKLGMRRGKITFETLDATLNYLNDDGDGKKAIDSISKRCADVDLVMSQFMGVSKAIINNVLLCHQEDSSWPLDEPKKLKEKFDAIFGISEYNKALERIIKMRKEEMDILKIKEADLRLEQHLKVEMEDKTMSLQKCQEKAKSIEEQCKQCEEEMAPIEERLQQIHKIEAEVGKYQAQKVELQTKQKNCQDQMNNLKKKIKTMFEGTLEELDSEIGNFGQKMTEKRTERREMEGKLNSVKKEEKSLQNRHNDVDKKRVVAIQQKQKEDDAKKKRADKLKAIGQQMNITIPEDLGDTTEEVAKILEEIKGVLATEQGKINETISQHDAEDQEIQTKIDQLRVEVAKLQESVGNLTKQKKAYEKESEQTEKKILEIEKSTQQLKVVSAKLKETEDCYEETSSKFNQEELRENIKKDKEAIKKLDADFRSVDERLTFLNSISKLVAELNLKEQELENREQEVRKVKSKHSGNFRKIFEEGKVVESNFQRHVKVTYEKSRRHIKELNNKINGLKLKEQRFEIKRKTLKDELQKAEKELEDCKETIFEKCRSTPYEELLTRSKTLLSKHQLELGAQKSAEAFYKQYLQKIEDEPYCPLCQKDMTTSEASGLTSELNDKIVDLPQNIDRLEKLIKEEQKKHDALLQLKPVIDKVAKLEQDIPKRKEDMKKLQDDLAECSKEIECIQAQLADPTANMDLANSMMGDMSLLDEAIKQVTKSKDDIAKLKNKFPKEKDSENENTSIDEVQAQKTAISTELEEKRKTLEQNQQYYEKNMDALNKLRDLKNTLKDQQVKLQEGIQNLPQLQERQTELSQLLVALVTEMQDNQGKVGPIKSQLSATIKEKSQQKDSNRVKVNQMLMKLDTFKRMDQDVQRLHAEVLDYEKLTLDHKLKTFEESLKISKEELQKLADNIAEMTTKVEGIKQELANQESADRDLKDNRDLKILQQKSEDLKVKYDALIEELGKLDFSNVSKEKKELTSKRDKITVRKGELLGQSGEVKHQIRKLEKELASPKYRNSLMNYRRIYYEVEVTRKMVNDLGQHRVALEWALMQFHTEKMREINRLIREYWRLIYRGNDIDYIQIQTEEGKDASSLDKRRNYNYRVIQSKNNSEIEMRGRCSAGQRVLASLIIRMALAETFSSNCGVLALDEPTTNLDRNNILSLCDALNRIVEERQTQSNFMLIIITHDEAFISTLGKVKSYNRVFRNDECKSVIRRVKVA
ncbi:DNA repair protein RAD50 [Stomoxys calcitrans]|uniref:DNA repair protein RAD50 n=1 Tax=Stomoxys calcitrans TaxID=35570 RepID=UPI0027E33E10|nr:DNA repair protein RAD50 [Stomoxys calcitrans]